MKITTVKFQTSCCKWLFRLVTAVIFLCNFQIINAQCTAPVATATPTSQTICSGSVPSVVLQSNIVGTTYAWTVVQTNVTGALSFGGLTIPDTLYTTGNVTGTAVFTIYPSYNGCMGNSITVPITIEPQADASFTYSSATYCQTGTNPTPVITGLPGGNFSAAQSGLSIDSLTGVIDLATSSLAAYTISYTTNGGTCPNTSSVNITITTAPSANFSYSYSAYCQDASNPSPVFGSGASAGTFSYSPVGIVLVDVNTGEIGIPLSAAGTYTITNTIPANGGCAAAIATTTVTITSLDDAAFVYSSPIYCQTETNPTPTITGVSGGTFSSTPTGLSIDSLTGTINISTSALGTFTVAYTTNSTCPNSSFLNITITNAVWPGDADNDSIVNNNDLLTIGLFYGQTGLARANISNAWQAYSSSNWGILESNGVDIKNADCNGDGIIDANDTLAINLNFSLTHLLPAIHNYNNERLPAPEFYFSVLGNSYNAGDWVEAALWLGSSTSPVNNLYGIAFNINYTSSLVQSGTESILYSDSWLGTPGTDVIKISKADAFANVAYGAVTRIDHTNANGFGKIADFKFQVNTSLNSVADINLSISNYLAVDNTGATIDLNPQPTSIYVVGIDEQNNNSEITIAPNPFNNQTIISFNEEQKHGALKITDVLGKEVRSINFSGKQLIIEKGEMQPGIYFVKIFDGKKIYDKKIVVQ